MFQIFCETFYVTFRLVQLSAAKQHSQSVQVGNVLKLNNLWRLFHLHEILRKVTRLYVKFDSIQHVKST